MNMLGMPAEQQRIVIAKMDQFQTNPKAKQQSIEEALSETPPKFGKALRLCRELAPREDGGIGFAINGPEGIIQKLKAITGTGIGTRTITAWENQADLPGDTPRYRNYMQALSIPADMQTRLIEAQHKVLAASYADYPKQFGDLLTRLRGEAMNRKTGTPFSRHALAKRLGVSDDMVINWENGVSVPRDELLERTATILRLSDYEQILLKEAINRRAQHHADARGIKADEAILQALASDSSAAFGLVLRAYREKAGLSHKQAQAQGGISTDKISGMENGKPYGERQKLCSYMDRLQIPLAHQLFVISGMDALRADLPAKKQKLDALIKTVPLPFGTLLHAYREIAAHQDGSYGYSADDAAAAIRARGHTLSQSTISRWESGKDWPKNLTILSAYLDLLQVPQPICQQLIEQFHARPTGPAALHLQPTEAAAPSQQNDLEIPQQILRQGLAMITALQQEHNATLPVEHHWLGKMLGAYRACYRRVDGSHGLTQKEFASQLQQAGHTTIYQTTISAWERGDQLPNDSHTLGILMQALHVPKEQQRQLCWLHSAIKYDAPLWQQALQQAQQQPISESPGILLQCYRMLHPNRDGSFGLSRQEAAQLVGSEVSEQLLYRWENGDSKPGDPDLYQRYLVALGIPRAQQTRIIAWVHAPAIDPATYKAQLDQQLEEARASENPASFGTMLRLYRNRYETAKPLPGITREQLSQMLGGIPSEQTLMKWETAHSTPDQGSHSNLMQVMNALKIPDSDKNLIRDKTISHFYQTDERSLRHRVPAPGTHITQPDHDDRIADRAQAAKR